MSTQSINEQLDAIAKRAEGATQPRLAAALQVATEALAIATRQIEIGFGWVKPSVEAENAAEALARIADCLGGEA